MAVKYYDHTGRRVPAPQHDSVPSSGETALLVIFLIAVIAAITAFLYKNGEVKRVAEKSDASTHVITHDSLTAVHTYNGETIRFYVMTDPDTGRQYLVNDRGGMCLREERDVY